MNLYPCHEALDLNPFYRKQARSCNRHFTFADRFRTLRNGKTALRIFAVI
tara:strand:+ start:726 stop:875 length:150 start_codon:yes stop_codon:yes gene_type:complete